jgi:hypothetical protein
MTTTYYASAQTQGGSVELRRPNATAMRACKGALSHLEAVGRRLDLLKASFITDRNQPFLLVSALLEALQRTLAGLQADTRNAGLMTELEALVLAPPAAGLPAIADLGLRRVGPNNWEVCYLEIEYQLERRPGLLMAAVEAFQAAFINYMACVTSVLECPALLREILALCEAQGETVCV